MKAELFCYAVVVASRKLRPYFLAHKIEVLTDQPISQILHKSDVLGRLVKWTIELSQYDIEYMPRKAIKGQVLADFVAELSFSRDLNIEATEPQKKRVKKGNKYGEVEKEMTLAKPRWKMFVDGSRNTHGSGTGIVIQKETKR